jgi:integrase/recombinase XerD
MRKKPEYLFKPSITVVLKGFKQYIYELGQSAGTIRQKSNYAGLFLKWLESENLTAKEVRYNDMLLFIDCMKDQGKSIKHVNTILRTIRNYYDYLKIQDKDISNPANNLYIKGTKKTVPYNHLKPESLESLYQSYKSETNRDKRNRIILGLFIYQAITTDELHKLEIVHIKLKEGKIYIPGSKRSSGRMLELKPFQILELHEYIKETRPNILAGIYKPKPARKPDKINTSKIESQLFMSINGSEGLKNSLLHLFKDVRKINPEITTPQQIRLSVISHWLKNYNLRQVQYMAGHKHVSSTERYLINNLEDLQHQLDKFHPLQR